MNPVVIVYEMYTFEGSPDTTTIVTGPFNGIDEANKWFESKSYRNEDNYCNHEVMPLYAPD